MPPPPSSPLPRFIPARAFWTLPVTLPINHTFRFRIHCLHWSRHSLSAPCPFWVSSVLETSVGPGLLIPSAFYTPPAPNSVPPPHPPPTPPPPPPTPTPTWPIGGLVREGHSPVIPLTDLCPSRTNPSICIYQPLNQNTLCALTSRSDMRTNGIAFKFSNPIVLCHLAPPHESIPSPQSS